MGNMPNQEGLAQEYAQLKAEVEKIAQYVQQAKLEILAISLPESETGTDKNLPHAATELEEVVRHTEEATNTIMDKAEAVMQISAVFTDPQIAEKLNAHALSILEACSFQDITGQRIRKVLKTLGQVEQRLNSLITLFGGTLPGVKPASAGKATGDEALLNGPQLTKNAPSQEDIDKLFSSL
jgi:chemotaxis protein CheZ